MQTPHLRVLAKGGHASSGLPALENIVSSDRFCVTDVYVAVVCGPIDRYIMGSLSFIMKSFSSVPQKCRTTK